jgi:hypothetical protein
MSVKESVTDGGAGDQTGTRRACVCGFRNSGPEQALFRRTVTGQVRGLAAAGESSLKLKHDVHEFPDSNGVVAAMAGNDACRADRGCAHWRAKRGQFV